MNHHVITTAIDVLLHSQLALQALIVLLGDAHDTQLQKIGALLRSVMRELEEGVEAIESEVYPESHG